MSIVAIRQANVIFQADLAASTATTAWPSSSSSGVDLPAGTTAAGGKAHILVHYSAAAGTLSTDVHVLGFVNAGAGYWAWLGQLNGAASIGPAHTKWSPATSSIVLLESVNVAIPGVSKIATRCVNPQGTSPVVSTWVGFEYL